MKHRIFIAVASVVLAAVILLLLPSAHPQETTPTEPDFSGRYPTKPTKPTASPQTACVRLYSCDENWALALEALAVQYTQLTGTEVVVLRPQEEDCQETLSRLMESEEPPTVLCVHSQSQLERWEENLLDLTQTDLAAALCADSFGLYRKGKLLAVPMDLEGFGLLVNLEVLGTKGALSRNDITDGQTLTMAAQILKDNSVKAFPTAALDALAAVHLLLGSDEAQIRSFLDFYMANSHTSGDAADLFQNGKCAFYLGGTWAYSRLFTQEDQALQVRNLDILPTFLAGGIQYGFTTAWCVNAAAAQEDVTATMEFLTWLVSAGEDGSVPVDALQTLTPFTDSQWYGNQLEKKLLTYMKTEPAVVSWTPISEADTKLTMALQNYMENRNDDNWAFLQTVLDQMGIRP